MQRRFVSVTSRFVLMLSHDGVNEPLEYAGSSFHHKAQGLLGKRRKRTLGRRTRARRELRSRATDGRHCELRLIWCWW